MYNYVEFGELLGQTLTAVTNLGESIVLETADARYTMYHCQDCCESVYVEDIIGDLDDLIGSPLLIAEETTDTGSADYGDSYTWTFYKLATWKGHVTIRWYGSSNGYYSESVSLSKETKNA